jgi:GT2 family glycosyltransferase
MSMASQCRPLVSIIVPTYNYAHFIGEALESVQSQTYSNWECIVVDDGSTDDTGIIAKQFADKDNRIKYHRQENQGLAAARNTGLANSPGVYFQFLDADDLLEPQKLERQVMFLESHPDVDIVFSDARYFRTGHLEERRFSQYEENLPWVAKFSGHGKSVLLRLIANNIMAVNAPLLRRSVIEDVGLFEGSVRGIEDWDYWVRCANTGKHFHYDDAEGTRALVRIHGTSMSTDVRLMLKSALLLHRRVSQMTTDDAVRQVNEQRMAEREGLLGVEEVAAGRLIAGMRQLCRAAMSDRVPRQKAKWLLCAATAPFVSTARLRRMVTSPVSSSIRKLVNRS